jgi:dUTP pyrophosphatase
VSEVKCVGTLPQYMTDGAAGADLSAAWGYEVEPGEQVMVDTGTSLQLNSGTVGLLVPRSSLCNKAGLTLVNSVGVLDEDYTGNIKLCYKNNGDKPVVINRGERIGQVVVVPYIKPIFVSVEVLDSTDRGDNGFGSTNKEVD